jgi:hypothetical protein
MVLTFGWGLSGCGQSKDTAESDSKAASSAQMNEQTAKAEAGEAVTEYEPPAAGEHPSGDAEESEHPQGEHPQGEHPSGD